MRSPQKPRKSTSYSLSLTLASGWKNLADTLLTMNEAHFDAKFPTEVLGQVLGRINASMLSASASKTEHEVCESTLDISRHMSISQTKYGFQKKRDLSVFFQKTNDGGIQSRQVLVVFIATGIVGATAIEHVSPTIA